MSNETVEDLKLFQSIGLGEQMVKEILKNVQVTQNLKFVISETTKHTILTLETGVLLYHLASKVDPQITDKIPLLAGYIGQKKLDTVQRIDAALDYLLSNREDVLNVLEFEQTCGIGVHVGSSEIESAVARSLKVRNIKIYRYEQDVGLLLQEVHKELKWADERAIKSEILEQLSKMPDRNRKLYLENVSNADKESKGIDRQMQVAHEHNDVRITNTAKE